MPRQLHKECILFPSDFLGSLKAQIMHRLAGTFPEKVVQIDCDPLDVRVGFAIFL